MPWGIFPKSNSVSLRPKDSVAGFEGTIGRAAGVTVVAAGVLIVWVLEILLLGAFVCAKAARLNASPQRKLHIYFTELFLIMVSKILKRRKRLQIANRLSDF